MIIIFKIVDRENIDKEHICCAISNEKDKRVLSKKKWLKDRFDEGLVFYKLDKRGKVFIEYIPIENTWNPIIGENAMHINCLWVSGKFKGKGYSNKLLDYCIEDAKSKDMDYISVISSKKKMPFLSDPKYLKYKGFILADKSSPYFELLYLPLKEDIKPPKIKDIAKEGKIDKNGLVLYYTAQCPHTITYVSLFKELAKEKEIDLEIIHLDNRKQARECPSLWTTYALFKDGKFLTNEILGNKKMERLLENMETRI